MGDAIGETDEASRRLSACRVVENAALGALA
jgi:hypothetical protein